MAAVDSVEHNRWGTMVALKGTAIESIDFDRALGSLKTVPQERWDEASLLFG
ncbi:Pyrophosphate--fructose 6-phosphate 1-phosphotransferase [compost metagenome]